MRRLSMKSVLKRTALPTLAMLAGCTVGPNFHQPAAPAGAGYSPTPLTGTQAAAGPLGTAQKFVQAQDIPGEWWTLFQSKPLDALIKQALAANPSIAAAQASLRVAEENTLAQDGSFFPSIGLQAGGSKNQTSTASLSPVAANNKAFYSLYTAQLSISYSPDVFGLNRRTVESLAAQAENKRDELEAAYLSLSSNVVMAAVQEAGLRAEIAAQEQTISADEDARAHHRASIRGRRSGAVGAAAAAIGAGAGAAAVAAAATPAEHAGERADRVIRRLPEPGAAGNLRPVAVASAADPAGQPALGPGGAAAGHSGGGGDMHSASAQIGVAIANRLPQFPLTAQFGTSPAAIANAFTPYNQFFTVAAGLATPLFDGGTLKHKQRAAVAQFDYAAAMYKQTVIGAFQNVSDTLRALQTDADQLQAAQTADNVARQNLDDRPHRIAGRRDRLLLSLERRADVRGGAALAGTGGDDAPHRYCGFVPVPRRRLVEPRRSYRRANDRRQPINPSNKKT